MKQRPLQSGLLPYGNCTVLPPDSDQVMFRCNLDRKDWYLERGLAVLISDNPPVLRLTFKPRGPGHAGDPYFLQEFKNRCVVCGTDRKLSHHHILPNCYRKFFPRTSQDLGRWMYDVLLLSTDCHHRYELRAEELKEDISREYGIPSAGYSSLTLEQIRVMKAAAALYRHGNEMPAPKKQEFANIVARYLGRSSADHEELRRIWKTIHYSAKHTPAGHIIAQRIADIDAFAIRWRRHFLKTMNPQFLPEGWNPERRIYSEPDQVSLMGIK